MTEIITNIESHWQPNKWVAVLLCFILVPVGMLYLGRKTWAIFYFILILIIVMLRFTLLSVYSDDDLWWMFSALNLTGMVHAFWLAGKVNKPRPWYSRWYGVTAVVLIFVIPLLTVKVFVYDLFRIPADSMAPTLLVGDVLNISKWGCGNYRYLGITFYHTKRGDSCEIKRGDVIAFQYPPNPNQDYIKRVVAVGGDDVSYYDDTLLINGEEVEFEFIDSNDEFSFYE